MFDELSITKKEETRSLTSMMISIDRLGTIFVLLIAVTLCSLAVGSAVEAAPDTPLHANPPQVDTLDVYTARGKALIEDGEYEEAQSYLQQVVSVDAGFQHDTAGSASYWLGRAQKGVGDEKAALSTWAAGVDAQDDIDVRLADRYVRSVFASGEESHYEKASEVYLSILETIDGPADSLQLAHVREMCPVLSDEDRVWLGMSGCRDEEVEEARDLAGEDLIRWWSRQDTDLSVDRNYRLEEHLERVADARSQYTHEGEIDDRGRIYIRYGPPHKERVVRLDERDDPDFSNRLTAEIGSVARYEDNVLWLYTGIDREANYLFVNTPDSGYELGEATDVIPSKLLTSSRRPLLTLRVMEYVYRQLSAHIHDYGRTYDTVWDLKSRLQFGELGGPADSDLSPQNVIAQSATQARRDERRVQKVREREVPDVHSDVRSSVAEFDAPYRTARFQNEEGTTRTEIYWALPEDSLRYFERQSEASENEETAGPVVQATAVQEGAKEERHTSHHPVQPRSAAPAELSNHQIAVVDGDSVQYDVRLQLDQYLQQDAEGHGLAPRARMSQIHEERIAPLNSEPGLLEMSDLKPLYASGGPAELDRAPPYPLQTIDTDTPLALHFEVYDLALGENDLARYQVEYELERVRERSGISGLFRGDDVQQTTTTYQYDSSTRKTEEYLLLDLDEFDGEGTLDITVTVTDEVTGQQTERSIDFEVVQ